MRWVTCTSAPQMASRNSSREIASPGRCSSIARISNSLGVSTTTRPARVTLRAARSTSMSPKETLRLAAWPVDRRSPTRMRPISSRSENGFVT